MHIGFLSPEYVLPGQYDGGLANYIHKVAHALSSRGHRVTVFVLSNQDRAWDDEGVKVIEVKTVKPFLIDFPTKIGLIFDSVVPAIDQIRSSGRIARSVWKQHREEPFDILQASSYQAIGFALRRNQRVPLVTRISSYTPALRAAYGKQRSLAETICDWLEIRQIINSDATFSPSQFNISLFERFEAFKPYLIRTPVDIIKIKPDPSIYEKELSGIRYLLFFGSLSKVKGVDLLADAIPSIIKSFPETHFVFIGRDDGMSDGLKLMDYVRNQNSSCENHIHYFPALPKAQLYSIVEHAVAVLMPSRVDNYPNACLEAQMLGIPVIGSRNSSLDEMIEDGKTGFLIENGNSNDLCDAVRKLMSLDEIEYHAMKQANLDRFSSITQEGLLNQLIDYLSAVILRFNEKK
jgi:glycosyltransferase involved in cell wall biosynthesis